MAARRGSTDRTGAPRRPRRAPQPARSSTPGRTAGAKKLKEYRAKRAFDHTPEPAGSAAPSSDQPRFVVQKHDATRLHYDVRLEVDGVLKSWAVPKGPSLDPADKRLAVRTEDHPIEYLTFEGVIPDGQYGAGPMIVWDTGTYESIKTDSRGRAIPMAKSVDRGAIKVRFHGKKLTGAYSLVRSGRREGAGGKEQWLMIKVADDAAAPGEDLLESRPESVVSGKTIDDLGARKRKTTTRRASASKATPAPKKKTARSKAATKSNAGRDPKPTWVAPMLATLAETPPDAGAKRSASRRPKSSDDHHDWLYEHKYDGFRALAFRDGDKLRLLSRSGKNLADRFPEIAEALLQQPLDDFIIDGEIVALAKTARGPRPSFSALQQRLKPTTVSSARRRGITLRFHAFDLLYAAGRDARKLPFLQRAELLGKAVHEVDPVVISERLSGKGEALLKRACREGWEGLIAKRAADPYISGRSRSWLKLKCSLRQEFVIGGWTDPQGSRTALGSLLLGYYENAASSKNRSEDNPLVFAGKVGTGFTDAMLRDLLAQLKAIERKTSPFAKGSNTPRRGAHFVSPTLVAEVGFTEWTHDGHVRHPRFLGLRADKSPRDVVREKPAE